MNQIIKCPNCQKEFNMAEGLVSHLKTIEDQTRETILKNKENEIKRVVQEQVNSKVKNLVNENKKHYESINEINLKNLTDNLNQQNSEKQKLWELKENRLVLIIDDLKKKATQGTTVDQGSSAESQLGDWLKTIFKDKKDKISEYAKGVAGGDWLQEIIENDFTICKILYESKNTKSWSDGWIGKLQDDMKESKSDIGIIFTRATPRDFPKHLQWDQKGNIFICKYDHITLRALATTQRFLLANKNKQKENGKDNILSAIEFIENPIITNLLMQKINISNQKKKKLEITRKNLDDLIDLDQSMDKSLEEFFSELDKIGLSTFLTKWKKD